MATINRIKRGARKSRRNAAYVRYGSVVTKRGVCDLCGETCIITNDNKTACCASSYTTEGLKGIFYETTPTHPKRKTPSAEVKRQILERQGNKCYWCEKEFGTWLCSVNTGKLIHIHPHWDHYVPYILTHDNSDDNFVAACFLCNGIKNKNILHLTSEAGEHILRNYILEHRALSSWRDIELDGE